MKKRRVLFRLLLLVVFFFCILLFKVTTQVSSEPLVLPPSTPTSYQVKFKVVLVGEVLAGEEIFYLDLEVLDDPRKYLHTGEVMPFEMPKEVYFRYKKLQGEVVYLWCEEFFYVDIKCDIYDYTKEE